MDTEALGGWLVYDGQGRHLAGQYRPLMVGGALTPEYVNLKERRPVTRFVGPMDGVLGAVWMLPDGIAPGTLLSAAVVGVLVQACDAGCTVRLDGATQVAVDYVVAVVEIWTGGSRA